MDVKVNVFNGSNDKNPKNILVRANTYQDIVTLLIQSGYKSGQIYTLTWNEIDYLSEVKYPEVNYVMVPTPLNKQLFSEVFFPKSEPYLVSFNNDQKIRDIYNYLVAQGESTGITLVYGGQLLQLEDRIDPSYNKATLLHIILPNDQRVGNAIPEISQHLNIRVLGKGNVSFPYNRIMRASELVQQVAADMSDVRLARSRRGEFFPYIYSGDEHVYLPSSNEILYITPDFSMLFNLAAYGQELQM